MSVTDLRILIVGGGIAGMSSAIRLRAIGASVDLIDLDPLWRVYGAGITVTSPTLRAFDQLGILRDFLEVGYAGDGIRICAPDGSWVEDLTDPFDAQIGIPGSGGIMRPELHRILSERVRASGTTIRLGLTVESLDQAAGDGVAVRFSDGTTGRYDIVVGADGLYSTVRMLTFADAPRPAYTGQMVWRLFAPRPAEVDRRHYYLGGPMKVGVCPVSDTHLYMFLLEKTPQHPIIPDAELHGRLAALMTGYGGVIGELRDGLNRDSQIVVRPLEAFEMPPPWHSGRVVIIGDAVHPTTPQLASGAGMAVEDALVLSEELTNTNGDIDAMLPRFVARRWARCRIVVENSLEIGRREQAGRPPSEQTDLVTQSLEKLAEPI
ncbi:FAD-dependent oxidoreductase [Sphingomonas sp.]|uniref:FAD-dependent oxidoreductase n=1 Tax=Sphingomonas sp. TaxID=28214 RepID=UPI0035A877C1